MTNCAVSWPVTIASFSALTDDLPDHVTVYWPEYLDRVVVANGSDVGGKEAHGCQDHAQARLGASLHIAGFQGCLP